MNVTVRYFASLRESLGAGESVALNDGNTSVGALRDFLIARSSAHAETLARGRAIRTALDQTLCEEGAMLRDGAEVAFFPPVTGG